MRSSKANSGKGGVFLEAGQWRCLGMTMTAAVALLIFSRPATAGPQGGTVTSGSAAISQSGKSTNINQSTDKAIINWRSFSVGGDETVNFNQPTANSATLNRVIGNEKSIIDGAVNANGKVFLVNSAGVLMGGGANINASGFTASALDISDSDFNAGRFNFSGSGSGEVLNLGTIRVGEGGHVVLMGKAVSNQGAITATKGTVALAGGSKVTLNFNGNSLVGVSIDQGVLDALVTNGQAIYADGGTVILTARAADALLSAQVNNTGIIQARSIGALKGRIELYAHGGTTMVDGTLDASAPTAGDGGFVETSGDKVKVGDHATITTKAAQGQSGKWLIDPTDLTVAASGGDMTGTALGNSLNNGSVEIQSSQGHSGSSGNVNINDNVTWSGNNVLTLTAQNNININKSITATGNTAGLVLNYGGDYAVNSAAGAKVTLSGAGATLAMNGNAYTLIHSTATHDLAQFASLINATPGGRFAIAEDIDASGATYTGAVATSLDGTLAGLGHTISGLNMAVTTGNGGLIGTVGAGATIRDLGLVNATITSNQTNVGGFTGLNNGTLSSVYVKNSTITNTSKKYTGGLAGRMDAGLIANSYVENTTVSGTASGSSYIGGLVGKFSGATIRDSHFSGTINAVAGEVGGLVGAVDSTSAVIANSYSTGTINANNPSATPNNVGGLAGSNRGIISDSHADMYMSIANHANVGGVIGTNSGLVYRSTAYSDLSIYNTRAANGAISGADNIGGFVGTNSGTIDASSAYGNVTTNGTVDVSMVGGFAGLNTVYGVSAGTITNSHAHGSVLSQRPRGGGYGGFVGTNFQGATIANSTASGAATSGYGVGGFVADNYGTITNGSATGNVQGLYSGTAGGFVGYNHRGGVINGALATGNVRSWGYGGPLYAENEGYIRGKATGTYTWLGIFDNGSNRLGGPTPRNAGIAVVIIQPTAAGNATAAAGATQAVSAMEDAPVNPASPQGAGGSNSNRKRSVDENIQIGSRGGSSGSVGTIRVEGGASDTGQTSR